MVALCQHPSSAVFCLFTSVWCKVKAANARSRPPNVYKCHVTTGSDDGDDWGLFIAADCCYHQDKHEW